MKKLSVVLVVGAVVACVVGCGGGKYASPKATFDTMVAAAKAGDKEAIMACFDQETRGDFAKLEELGKKSKKQTGGVDKMSERFKAGTIEYGKETIEGDKATLEVTLDGETQPMKFVKEDGQWKISIPELKMAVQMMEGMKGMMEGMMKGMGEGMKKMGKEMGKTMEDAMKKAKKTEN